jgi:hypothetical protein
VITGAVAAEYISAEDVDANRTLTGAPKANTLAEGTIAYNGPRLTASSVFSEKQTNARPTGFEIGARSMRVEHLVSGEARLRLGGRSQLAAEASRLRMTWDADQIYNGSVLAENLNGQFLAGSLHARIMLSPVTTVVGGVEVIDQQFFRAPMRNNTSSAVQGGVEFSPPGLLSGRLMVGNRRTAEAAADGSDVSGITLMGNLTYARPTGAALTATVTRDKQASYDITQGFFRTTGGTVLASTRAVRGWTAFASVGYYRFVYSESFNRFETHLAYGGGAYVRPTPRLRMGALVERYDRAAPGGMGLAFSGFLFRVYSTYGVTLAKPLDRQLP